MYRPDVRGIGKTILWQRGVEDAHGRFGHVLLHRSAEAEASLSFTGLSDLVAPVFERVATSLAPVRRHALEVALLLAEPDQQAPDPRAIGLALLDTLIALAEDGHVLARHASLGLFRFEPGPHPAGTPPELLFCDNETNAERLFGLKGSSPYPKDGINDHVVAGGQQERRR